jgi:hypothetical protein
VVVEERRTDDGPGGVWYRLEAGGWVSDMWITESRCNDATLEELSFTDCWAGEC